MKKYFVEKGLYAGEMVIITNEANESKHVTVQPIDDHGRNMGEEVVLPKDVLIELS